MVLSYVYVLDDHIGRSQNGVVTIYDLSDFSPISYDKVQLGDVRLFVVTLDCDVQSFVLSSVDYSKSWLYVRDAFDYLVLLV